jgi:hypothetical protein
MHKYVFQFEVKFIFLIYHNLVLGKSNMNHFFICHKKCYAISFCNFLQMWFAYCPKSLGYILDHKEFFLDILRHLNNGCLIPINPVDLSAVNVFHYSFQLRSGSKVTNVSMKIIRI